MTTQLPAELPDNHLVAMAKRDSTAFVHLYDRYGDEIFRYCARSLTRTSAEDVTSITFLNALKAINRFDPDRGTFRSWLFRIAHNAIIDQTRVRNHALIEDDAFEDPGQNLDDHVVALDQRYRLFQAVRRLPPDQQQVIHLRLASLTGAQIAEAMGRSHVAVRSLQHRAIKQLRGLLQPDYKEEHAHDQEQLAHTGRAHSRSAMGRCRDRPRSRGI